jgi:hypothetical protein
MPPPICPRPTTPMASLVLICSRVMLTDDGDAELSSATDYIDVLWIDEIIPDLSSVSLRSITCKTHQRTPARRAQERHLRLGLSPCFSPLKSPDPRHRTQIETGRVAHASTPFRREPRLEATTQLLTDMLQCPYEFGRIPDHASSVVTPGGGVNTIYSARATASFPP